MRRATTPARTLTASTATQHTMTWEETLSRRQATYASRWVAAAAALTLGERALVQFWFEQLFRLVQPFISCCGAAAMAMQHIMI
jgi:hypothetical protein